MSLFNGRNLSVKAIARFSVMYDYGGKWARVVARLQDLERLAAYFRETRRGLSMLEVYDPATSVAQRGSVSIDVSWDWRFRRSKTFFAPNQAILDPSFFLY